MPSAALARWQTDRLTRLGHVDAHCAALLVGPAAPPLAREVLEGYVLLLSGHFQGFCRDLYSESVQVWVTALPAPFQMSAQKQAEAELRLNIGNPTAENINRDFARFDIRLILAGVNPTWVTHLGQLNYWRNAVAHQSDTPPPTGMPPTLSLPLVQTWLAACDGLAGGLDGIMFRELLRVIGTPPW